MESIFLELLNRSINAGWLVLAIILLRRLLKKAPKTLFIVLWALVGIRLICPFTLESAFSLLPSADPIRATILHSEAETPSVAVNIANETDLTATVSAKPSTEHVAEAVPADKSTAKLLHTLPTAVWMIGMLGLLLYAAISSLHLHQKVRESVPLRENIRLCDCIDTPFLLGLVRPRIYLPFSLAAADAEYAIAHERAHIRRHDHWWKPLGFLLLTVYWFNPLLWIAYMLLCRDIELACDERVIRQLGAESKKPYSIALINCSVPRRTIAMCPLAFGEVAVRERVKTVLHYKKPTFWLSAIAVLTCIAATLGFLTDPIGAATVPTPSAYVTESDPVEVPAAKLPVKEIGTAETPAEDEVAVTLEQFCARSEYTAEELAQMHAVLCHRIQTCYSSFDVDEYGNWYESYNYELPEEIAEKYGTRDCLELPDIIVYESIGVLDSTETLEFYYGTFDPFTGAKNIERTEIVTIEIPAGEVAFYVVEDPGCIGCAIRGGTYGDLSVTL